MIVQIGSREVHGIDDEFLATQPRFGDVAADFLDFVRGAELVIHNAEFDVEFINHELRRLPEAPDDIRECCGVLDTLAMARRMHPGQRNSLDALAKRYQVDNSKRELHGALLDAQILAEIYLTMTGGQVSLSLDAESAVTSSGQRDVALVERADLVLAVPRASAEEEAAHEAMLARIRSQRDGPALWDALSGSRDGELA